MIPSDTEAHALWKRLDLIAVRAIAVRDFVQYRRLNRLRQQAWRRVLRRRYKIGKLHG